MLQNWLLFVSGLLSNSFFTRLNRGKPYSTLSSFLFELRIKMFVWWYVLSWQRILWKRLFFYIRFVFKQKRVLLLLMCPLKLFQCDIIPRPIVLWWLVLTLASKWLHLQMNVTNIFYCKLRSHYIAVWGLQRISEFLRSHRRINNYNKSSKLMASAGTS